MSAGWHFCGSNGNCHYKRGTASDTFPTNISKYIEHHAIIPELILLLIQNKIILVQTSSIKSLFSLFGTISSLQNARQDSAFWVAMYSKTGQAKYGNPDCK